MTASSSWNRSFSHSRNATPKREMINEPEVVSVFLEIADHVVATGEHNVLFDLRIAFDKDLGDECLISRC
jgi:hypothetical protein